VQKFVQEICGERNHDSQAKRPEKDHSRTKNALTEILGPNVSFESCRQDTVRNFFRLS
jgi:hypothetical protein